jgi:ABC-type transport system involved in multi-copper enzyme maturation permease subunit
MAALARWFLDLWLTNPICVRLVQGGSRRRRHLLIRTGFLAALMLVLLWSLLFSSLGGSLSYRNLAAAGAASFKYTAYLQIGLICLLSPVFMAGAISQEANPRTWDILLTTPLSAAQLVLGNLFGRLFFVLALLFSSLPLFAVTQYYGGAPGSAIFASYAIAACAALLVGAMAVTLSVSRLAGQRAVFTFYVAVVTYIAATYAGDLLLRRGEVTVFTALNPFLALESMLEPAGYARPSALDLEAMSTVGRLWYGSPVLAWCVLSVGLSGLLSLAGVLVVRRPTEGTLRLRGRRRIDSPDAPGVARAPRAVWNNPVAWREALVRAGSPAKVVARWGFVSLGVLWGVGLILAYHAGRLDHESFRFALLATVWTEIAVVSLIAVNMAGSAISREREDGTLDLLLVTPITPKAYLDGKIRGLTSYLAPLLATPVSTIALAGLYVLADGLSRADGVTVTTQQTATGAVISTPVVMPEAAIVAPILFAAFIAFCVMVGLQWSLRSRGSISSVIATFGVVAVIAAIVGGCGWLAASDVPYLGPALACLNPASALFVLAAPETAARETLVTGGSTLGGLRVSLLAGTGLAVVGYGAIVYAMRASMVQNFDMTVRRLAGLR